MGYLGPNQKAVAHVRSTLRADFYLLGVRESRNRGAWICRRCDLQILALLNHRGDESKQSPYFFGRLRSTINPADVALA
jgi:hypothetical protein